MDGWGICGQSAAAESEAKTDPNPVEKAARAETQATPPARAAANDDDGGSPLPGEDLPVQAELPVQADLLGAEQIRDEFQNERGIRVHMDRSRDANLTEFGQATLTDRYLMPGGSFKDTLARADDHHSDARATHQRQETRREGQVGFKTCN